MILISLLLIQSWGIGGGIIEISGRGIAPLVSTHYSIDISDNFLIRESLEYWQKVHIEAQGTRNKNCKFSGLSFTETALVKFNRGNISIGGGAGIGIHLLKNYVKDRKESGSWIITDYYALNSNAIGFHIETSVGSEFQKFSLTGGLRWGIILVDGECENIFYTRGNIQERAYYLCLSF